MPTVFVYCQLSSQQVKTKLERQLLWYDTETKKMCEFHGGRLIFAYGYDPGVGRNRLMPKVEDVEIIQNKVASNANEIKNWFDSFVDEFNSDIDIAEENYNEGWIEFDVPENEMGRFITVLDFQDVNYRVYNA